MVESIPLIGFKRETHRGTELLEAQPRVGLVASYAQGTAPAAVYQCPVLVMRFGHSSIFSSIAEASGY